MGSCDQFTLSENGTICVRYMPTEFFLFSAIAFIWRKAVIGTQRVLLRLPSPGLESAKLSELESFRDVILRKTGIGASDTTWRGLHSDIGFFSHPGAKRLVCDSPLARVLG